MTRLKFLPSLLLVLFFACDDDEPMSPTLQVPETYTFERQGTSTVNFEGQQTRIAMAEELIDGMMVPSNTEAELQAMFRNEGPNGEDVEPYASAELNAATQSIRSKVAASRDYFFADATTSALIKADFDLWLEAQAAEVFPRWDELATAGQAGQIADGSRARYVNANGLEYNQVFAKSLIGALMVDQALNNYLSPAVLDEADNRANNDGGLTEDGQPYTTMEHKWDEAYGYVFGAAVDPADPLPTLGDDDSFLNEYVQRVDADPDYTGIAEDIFDAFVRGRAAIVAGDYAERDAQADIIRELVSRVIAVRGIFYLMRGADAIETGTATAGFHALSEAYGFVYSLQFTHDPASDAPYMDRAAVIEAQHALVADNENGLWTVSPATIRSQASLISDAFGLTLAEAAE
ncbi:DUF4856 domain-containing protein [Lewinella sp. IMCC34191]|uniref:DUF4856 domain-containing protein n=1 Tax=Lewinella sp. IMCC34191 TaxID=2259172 RepID=UPI000E2403CC|nr:DUF4856 domain-containing protein [Lewinella sp. IMCC34191]